MKASLAAHGLLQPIGIKLVKETYPRHHRPDLRREQGDRVARGAEAAAALEAAGGGRDRAREVARWERIPTIIYPQEHVGRRCACSTSWWRT